MRSVLRLNKEKINHMKALFNVTTLTTSKHYSSTFVKTNLFVGPLLQPPAPEWQVLFLGIPHIVPLAPHF